MKKLILSLCVLLPIMAFAQTDATSKLKNPSFESDFTGWTQSGMQTQTNNSFTKKAGAKYVEKWTGRGGAVGSCSVEQTVTDLPVGTYRLTVAAQNIQEDTPSASQTGAWIFAGNEQTPVTVTADYSVDVVVLDGTLALGFKAIDASGNWIAVDNFRLSRIDDAYEAMRAALQAAVDAARALYGDGSGIDAAAFDAAIKEAEAILANNSATSEEMATQKKQLAEAEADYRLANASETQPLDLTSRLTNPSFENGSTGWVQSGMQIQSNNSFTLKHGNNYVERWTERGGSVGDGSVLQTVTGLPCGRYRLTAAAQNIQEDTPNQTKEGAWIVGDYTRTAVGVRAEYSVTFIVITGDATVGFVAEGAKGNWIACDHFRLEYLGEATAEQKAEMRQRIEAAEALTGEKMNTALLTQLQTAISAAKNATDGDYATVAITLRDVVAQAEASIKAYAALKDAITAAEEVCATGDGNERETFQAVINAAQAMYDSGDSQNDATANQIKALEQAALVYRVNNGSGTVPKVTTDKRYARGAIEAFGRMQVSGVSSSQILEQGFCWSTDPYPTVLDNRTTDYLECNGRIYRMSMEPATIYYIRAYAMTKTYAVGYGDIIKISTLPMGKVTYSYNNNDGGDFHNQKNNNALTEACWYWSNYTSIRDFHVSCSYQSWTETANCGYGGGMTIGPNTGQRTGTCMHEMNHGIGGGTIDIWGGYNESPLRTSVNGDWAGDRTNNVLRFWENREDLVVTAAYDGAHWGFRTFNDSYSDQNMWYNKYAFNGSHLEAGNWAGPQNWNDTQIVYIGNSLINQAMCEDGLVPVNYWSGGFCLPAYVFEQDDMKKYYIKSESPDRGLYDAYLTEGKANKISWTSFEEGAVTDNDSAAWYVSFDPKTQYYMLRNAATDHLLTYSGGFKTVARMTPSSSDKFHFMQGRVDVNMGNTKTRGYWIIHPESSNNPSTMTAAASGKVSSTSLNLYDTSTQQRWVFISADEVEEFEQGTLQNFRDELIAYISQIRKLKETPHTEDTEGVDEQFEDIMSGIETSIPQVVSAGTMKALLTDAVKAGTDFLSNVTPSDPQKPFDLTFMVTNAAINSNEGWSDAATFNESCCEYYQRTFDFNQTVTGLPRGNFKLTAQAFQRPGSYSDAYKAYAGGNNNVSAVLYAGSKTQKVCHIGDGAQTKRVHSDDVQVGSPAVYIPNTMASAAAYFKKGEYENEVWATTVRKNGSLKIGIRGNVTQDGYWTIFDNFHLYYFGKLSQEEVTPVEAIVEETPVAPRHGVYSLNGTLVRPTNDLEGLPAGIYIVGGKKVVVR